MVSKLVKNYFGANITPLTSCSFDLKMSQNEKYNLATEKHIVFTGSGQVAITVNEGRCKSEIVL